MNIEKSLRKAYASQADIDARTLPRPHTVCDKSNTEKNTEYHLVGYGLLFCLHDKTYFEKCHNCRRTKAEALNNLKGFLSSK